MDSSNATTEPRVVTEDIRGLLRDAIRPEDPDYGEAVQLLAEKALTSTRTVYRVLGGKYNPRMDLGLADRLALAAGSHLCNTTLDFNGDLRPYLA